ncbi:MAG: D-aminoacyl-tRNA deacylase [Armatimonadota bacterium]
MRAVVQRSLESSVSVDGRVVAKIPKGLVVLLGVGQGDTEAEAAFMADKIANLRIFEDAEGKMNLSVKDVGGEVLLISQFTLYGDCRKGRRPSFIDAAPPEEADRLYRLVADLLRDQGLKVETGEFGAHMLVNIQNDGPVTILIDSAKTF